MARARASTVQTALCVIPPEHLWPPIQAIRSQHDRAYPRWMPHINLVYPFVPEQEFPLIKARLAPAVQRHQPFSLQFDASSFHYFTQRAKRCTYHLRPKEATDLVALQKSIENQLPNTLKSDRPFQAHLTLGQCQESMVTGHLNSMAATWIPMEFVVDRVFLISRENHPEDHFVIKEEIPLLGQTDSVASEARTSLCLHASNKFSSPLLQIFKGLAFHPSEPVKMILAEYDSEQIDPAVRSHLESTDQFDLHFGTESLIYDPSTSRLSLRPSNIESLDPIKSTSDGTFYLGDLNPNDFDQARDRYRNYLQSHPLEEHVERLYLRDRNQATKFIFRLKMK